VSISAAGGKNPFETSIPLEVHVAKQKTVRAGRTRTRNSASRRAAANPVSILAWDDDPGAPDESPARGPETRPKPNLGGVLAIAIKGKAPAAGQYAQNTPQFRYWTAADALARGIAFWSRILPAGTRWFTGAKLPVTLDAGEDLNAYYDRAGLNFFHRTVRGHELFSGESADVVCHELGHAVLDAIRPELWDTATAEAAAFHESFGDMSALLCNLQLESVRREVLGETGGRLYQSSRLSRLAEQLGWGIRQLMPDQAERDCLRNAVNRLFYRDPNSLPPSGPVTSLSSEPHSFSRVFTGAFFEGLAGLLSKSPDEAELLAASEEAARLLVRAVLDSPIVPDYYSQIAAHIVSAATRPAAREAFRAAFVRHGVLSLQAAVSLDGHGSRGGRRRAATAKSTEASLDRGVAMVGPPESAPAKGVRSVTVPGARFGLSVPMRIQAPVDVKRYSVASAAVDLGSVPAPSVESSVTGFLEDLFRRGRIDTARAASAQNAIRHPFARRTHELVERNAELTLQRRCFDCGFDQSPREA
jgi:hypothetical protein